MTAPLRLPITVAPSEPRFYMAAVRAERPDLGTIDCRREAKRRALRWQITNAATIDDLKEVLLALVDQIA